jgi:hypothetical protein
MQAVLIIARAGGLPAAGGHADTVAAIVYLSGGVCILDVPESECEFHQMLGED